MEKYLNEGVIWSVALESKTQRDGSVFETLIQMKKEAYLNMPM